MMLKPRKMQYDKAGPKVAEALNKRYFEAYYCPDRDTAVQKVLELISADDTVSWGGTLTVDELGIKDLLRAPAQSNEERVELMRQGLLADTFLTSSNAVTADGQLFNIDGNGNRVAAFCYGPKQVIVVAGMNKVVPDMDAAYSRVRGYTAPGVVQRFPAAKTPCNVTGLCADCMSPDSCTYPPVPAGQAHQGGSGGRGSGPVTAGENCCGACAYRRKHCEAFYEKLNLLMVYYKEEIQFENKGISPRKWGK